jgi:hypothetical protein
VTAAEHSGCADVSALEKAEDEEALTLVAALLDLSRR